MDSFDVCPVCQQMKTSCEFTKVCKSCFSAEADGIAFLREGLRRKDLQNADLQDMLRDASARAHALMTDEDRKAFNGWMTAMVERYCTAKKGDAITICGWCAGTGKVGPSILEVPCPKCFGSGDPTKPTPGVQSS
jgi:hypothetical protein